MSLCESFASGMCKYGRYCAHTHAFASQNPCMTCAKSNCRFVHGGWKNADAIKKIHEAKRNSAEIRDLFSQLAELRSLIALKLKQDFAVHKVAKKTNWVEIALLHHIFDGTYFDLKGNQIKIVKLKDEANSAQSNDDLFKELGFGKKITLDL